MPPYKPIFQVIESRHDDDNLEKLSMETTVLNMHYMIHIIRLISKGQPWPSSSAINLAIFSINSAVRVAKRWYSIAIAAM